MNKFLKIAFLAITLISAIKEAQTEDFYLGGALGLGTPDGSYRALNPIVNDRHFATIGRTSALIGGLWGADYFLCDCVYLAFEVNALWNTYNEIIHSNSTPAGIVDHEVKLRNRFQYGGSIKFGTEVCGIIPYVLVGLEAARWNLDLNNNSNIANRGIPRNSDNNFAKTLIGPRLGFGVRFPIMPCVKVDMQYAYNIFGRVATTLVDSITSASWGHRAKIRQSTILLSLNYVF